jgi:hypothetical protein
MQEELKARLHPHWVGGEAGYAIRSSATVSSWSSAPVIRSGRCPSVGSAGHHRQAHLARWQDGKPRTIIDIARAAKLTVEEAARAPRFRKYRERSGSEGYSPEEAVTGREAA